MERRSRAGAIELGASEFGSSRSPSLGERKREYYEAKVVATSLGRARDEDMISAQTIPRQTDIPM